MANEDKSRDELEAELNKVELKNEELKALGIIEKAGMAMQIFRGVYPLTFPRETSPTSTIIGGAQSFTDHVYKAVIPNFLYKPPFGYPTLKNIPEIRRMAKTSYADMIIKTITSEVASQDWDIKPREGKEIPDEIIQQTKDFFYNPNRNEESIDFILRSLVRDILEIDAGVIVKVKDLKGDLKEIYVRDGASFTKNPDVFGILPELSAYWQYGWSTVAKPVPFNRDEIVYIMINPRADSIYGQSAIEVLLDILELLTYGVESNLEYFTDNNIPKGTFVMEGANAGDIKAFGEMWQEALKKKDPAGFWKRYYHKMPIMNKKGEFIKVAFSNLELELIEQQKWFFQITVGAFNTTKTELGFTDDSNKATEIIQSSVHKRKAIAPINSALEYHFTTEIINDLPWIKDTIYEGDVMFEFDKFDLQEEMNKRQLYKLDIDMGVRTPNEIRTGELNMEAHDDGDSLKGAVPKMFGFTDTKQANLLEADARRMDKNADNLEKEDKMDNPEGKSKKKVEKKALISKSSLILKPGEELAKFSVIENAFKKTFAVIEKEIKSIIQKHTGLKVVDGLKALDGEIINNIIRLISFEGLRNIVTRSIKANYNNGMDDVAESIGRNFMPNPEALNFLQNYTFDNVKGLEEDIKNKLRQELQRGIMAGEGTGKLAKRVSDVMDIGMNRAKAIARTETNRAENMGSLDGWRQSGLDIEKEWLAVIDGKTSQICKALDGKKIGINDKFKYKGDIFDSPPAHVSCRSTLVYSVKEAKK